MCFYKKVLPKLSKCQSQILPLTASACSLPHLEWRITKPLKNGSFAAKQSLSCPLYPMSANSSCILETKISPNKHFIWKNTTQKVAENREWSSKKKNAFWELIFSRNSGINLFTPHHYCKILICPAPEEASIFFFFLRDEITQFQASSFLSSFLRDLSAFD